MEVLEVDENEIKEVLEKHESQLSDHAEKIVDLQIKNASHSERFTHIDSQIGDLKTTLIRMENTSLQTTNILMNTLSQIAINTNSNAFEIKKEDNKDNNELMKIRLGNRANITLKILGIIGGLISAVTIGYFALKGVTIPPVM